MEEGDKKHEEYMKSFADSMKTLTDVISNGFGMLQGVMIQQNGIMSQPQMPRFNSFAQHGFQQQHPQPNNWGMQFPTHRNPNNQEYRGESLLREVVDDEL